MKKYNYILAIIAVTALISCGGQSSTKTNETDTLQNHLDSTAVSAIDTNVAKINPTDTIGGVEIK
jgi:hypothetical protein